jgi:hypothetical protein
VFVRDSVRNCLIIYLIIYQRETGDGALRKIT